MPHLLLDITACNISLQLTANGLATCLQVSKIRLARLIRTDYLTIGLPRRNGFMPHARGCFEGRHAVTSSSLA